MIAEKRVASVLDDLASSINLSVYSPKLKGNKINLKNPNKEKNLDFNFKDLNTIGNHWIKKKGKEFEGQLFGHC